MPIDVSPTVVGQPGERLHGLLSRRVGPLRGRHRGRGQGRLAAGAPRAAPDHGRHLQVGGGRPGRDPVSADTASRRRHAPGAAGGGRRGATSRRVLGPADSAAPPPPPASDLTVYLMTFGPGARGLGAVRAQRDLDSRPGPRHRSGVQLRPVRLSPGELHPALRARADVVLDGGLSRRPLRGPVRARQPLGLGAGAGAHAEREGAAADLPALERRAGAPVLPLRLLPRQLLDPGARRDRSRVPAARCVAQTADRARPVPPTGSTRNASRRTTRRSTPGCCSRSGERVDRPISAWEEMFLPLKLREHVRLVTVPGPNGTRRAAGPVRAHALRVDGPAATRRAARLAALVPGGRRRHRRRGLVARAARARERRGQRRLRARSPAAGRWWRGSRVS